MSQSQLLGCQRLNSIESPSTLHSTEEQWLLDPDEEDLQIHGMSLPLAQKVVTSAPISSSGPSPIKISRRSKYYDNEEYQSLLPNSIPYSDTPSSTNANYSSIPSTPMGRRDGRSRSIISLDLRGINDTVSKWTQSFSQWTSSSKNIEGVPTQIQYSVFKPTSSIHPITSIPSEGFVNQGPVTEADFDRIVEDAIEAINSGIAPSRISAGSSGSYFIYNTRGEKVGVFKPKDEEPYGPLSPKWTKWLHRNLFPCFFGRSCLIPNLAYICESAASLLDKQLQTYIVPFTGVVSLSSDRFYYSFWDKRALRLKKRQLPPKIGSFQLFLNDYLEADQFFQKYPLPGSKWSIPALYYATMNSPIPSQDTGCDSLFNENVIDLDGAPAFKWTAEILQQFRQELEKLVILDYIMRNTDRGLDNWMINITWETRANGVKHPKLKIGAIDSGLSWPWKHPDEWRSYPYGWLFLPISIIGQPFSQATREHFLPILTSVVWWEECAVLFRDLFAKDSDFKERMWKKQWAVMKGQSFNVVETLKNPTHGPLELARRTRILVHDEVMEVPVHIPVSSMADAMETPISQTMRKSRPNIRVNGGNSATNLESIQEAEDSQQELGSVSEESQNYQRNWNDLLEGNIDELDLSPKKQSNATSTDLNTSTGITQESSSASRLVVIERLQMVTSKPPVFTWC